MVEFTDLTCPYCGQFHVTVFAQLKREYIDTGKVRYLTRDFPLDSIHPLAVAAARAARCASRQGEAAQMRHIILSAGPGLKPDAFTGFARALQLDTAAFRHCVEQPSQVDALWRRDREDGIAIGISGTPSFAIGRSAPHGLRGVRISGARPFAVFDAKFRELLAADADVVP